jgi:hypothetical protein
VVGSAELRSSSDIEFLSTSWLSSSPASLPTSDLHQPQFAVAVRTRFTQPILKLSNCSSATWSSSLAFSSEHGEPLGCLLTSYAGSSNSRILLAPRIYGVLLQAQPQRLLRSVAIFGWIHLFGNGW